MRLYIVKCFGLLCCGLSTALGAQTSVLFEDTFESGNLDQWIGDVHLAHHGTIVADPLRGRKHVLRLPELKANGDIFTVMPILVANTNQQYVVSFDSLGLAQPDSVPDNLGGFLGIAPSIDDWQDGRYWLAGTD